METAEQFYEQERLNGNTDGITSNPNPDYDNIFYKDIFFLMIEFAKMHVQEALKQASEKAEIICAYGKCDMPYCDVSCETINKKSILNAYPLENIN